MCTNSYATLLSFMNINFDRSKISWVFKFGLTSPILATILVLAMSVMFYVSKFNPSLFIVSNQKYKISNYLSYPKYICYSPYMVTNSFQEWAVPIWEIFVFPNGDPRMVMGIPVW
jgi:hypothetical protein